MDPVKSLPRGEKIATKCDAVSIERRIEGADEDLRIAKDRG
jgi:hypothetical protein